MTRTRTIAQAGMIAAVYAAVTVLTLQFLQGMAWGPVQLRVSEAVTVVAFFTPAAIPGLTLGSAVANLYMLATTGTPVALLDVLFGSLGSFLGAVWMWRFRRRTAIGLMGPVVSNALIVPAYLPLILTALGVPLDAFYRIELFGSTPVRLGSSAPYVAMYVFGVVAVGIGQAVVMYGLGLPLLLALRKLGLPQILAQGE